MPTHKPTLIAAAVRPNAAWTVGETGIVVYLKNRAPVHLVSLPGPARNIADIVIAADGTVWSTWFRPDNRMHRPLALARSGDGGRHWSSISVDPASGAATADILLGRSGPTEIVTKTASNTAFSSGARYIKRGLSWTSSQLPAGGEVTAVGDTLWLAGGVAHDHLWVSRDGGRGWQLVALPGVAAGVRPGSGGPVVAAPVQAGGLLTVVVATGSHLRFLTSVDQGRTWTTRAEATGHAEYAGAAPPISGSDDTVFLIDSGHMWRFTPQAGTLTSVRSHPAFGPIALFISEDRRGLALYDAWACPTTKASCDEQQGAAVTSDGGRTWALAAEPATQ